jgi:hypothetical protein
MGKWLREKSSHAVRKDTMAPPGVPPLGAVEVVLGLSGAWYRAFYARCTRVFDGIESMPQERMMIACVLVAR